MSAPATPSNLQVQQGNTVILISYDLSAGATSYTIQRSTDQVNYNTIASTNALSYVDSTVTVGVAYYYQVAAVNVSGASPFTPPLSAIAAPTSEMSLAQLRLMSQQKADRVNSQFVTNPEWNNYINLAMFELYDLLVEVEPDLFTDPTPWMILTNGSTYLYPLPNGIIQYYNGVNFTSGFSLFTPNPFYKLMGVDLAVSIPNQTNAWVTMNKYNFMDRNKFIYPNTSSTIYGVFNLRYRLVGQSIEFIPTPTANQQIRIWQVPRLNQLLQETDITTIGFSGWLQYVIVRAAKYALDKEESDTSKLDSELVWLKDRIESTASNRDAGRPDTVTDVQTWGNWGMNGPFDGFRGGF